MDEKKLQELMGDEEFVKQIASLKTVEEIQAAFKAKGFEISSDEIQALMQEGKQTLEEDELDKISGGSFLIGSVGNAAVKFGVLGSDAPISTKLGFVATDVAGVALLAGIGYAGYKGAKKLADVIKEKKNSKAVN